eukprot:UN00452
MEQELENTQRQWQVANGLDPVSTQEYRKFVEQLKTQNATAPTTSQNDGQQDGEGSISIPTTNNSATIMSLSNHDPVRNAKNNSLPPPVAVTPTKSMQPTQLTIGTSNNTPPTATPALNTNFATNNTTATTFNKPLTPKRATTANVFGPGITTTAGPTAPYSSRGKSPVRAVPQSPRSAAMNNNNNTNNLSTTSSTTNLIIPSQDLPSHASNTSTATTDSTGPAGTPTNAHRTPQKVGSKRWVFAPAPQSATTQNQTTDQVLETPVTQPTQQKIPKT